MLSAETGQRAGIWESPQAEAKALKKEIKGVLWHGLGPLEHTAWPPSRRLPQPPPGLPIFRYLFASFPTQAHPTRLSHAAPVARSRVSRLAAWAFAFTPHVQTRPP